MFGRKKIYNCKKLIHVFKIAWVKESTLCVNSFLKNYFCKKVCSFCEKRTSKIWDVLFLLSYLPPLSDFVLFCLTPPTPPKIGHHLCTFPKWNHLKSFEVIWDHLESFKSWGDKISYTVNIQCLLSFFEGSRRQCFFEFYMLTLSVSYAML